MSEKITPASQHGRTETLNGVRLYFEMHGTGEPVLLLHGFSGSSQDWIPSVSMWGDSFQLIIPYLRGHGRSSPLSKTFRHDEAAVDMFALHRGFARINADHKMQFTWGPIPLRFRATAIPLLSLFCYALP